MHINQIPLPLFVNHQQGGKVKTNQQILLPLFVRNKKQQRGDMKSIKDICDIHS